MDLADVSQSLWQFDADSAKLATPTFCASLSLKHPALGLHDITVSGRKLVASRIFQVGPIRENTASQATSPARDLEDCYCRGRDLIVSYAASKEQPLRTELIWRVHNDPSDGIVGVELIVSVQTDSLGTDPQLHVASTLTARQTQQYVDSPSPAFIPVDAAAIQSSASHGYLIAMDNITIDKEAERIAHFVHPDDFHGASLSFCESTQGPTIRIANTLFVGELEKGVILRGRMALFILAGSGNGKAGQVDDAIAAYRHFVSRPLPLAT